MQTALKKHSLDLILIFSTYAMIPVYLLPSGSVQLVDITIVVLAVVTAINITAGELKESFRHVVPFMPFVAWSVIVNTWYTISSNHLSYILASVELMYTLAIMVLCSIILKRMIARYRDINYILVCVLVSCIVAMFVPSYSTPYATRVQLSFNNPNQLAYYAVLILTSLMIIDVLLMEIYSMANMHVIITIIVAIIADGFAFISASRAGLVSSILINIMLIYVFIKHNAMRTIIILAITFGIMLAIYSNIGKWHYMSKSINDAITRFTTRQIIDERNLDNRWFGYLDYKNPYTIIFGDGGRFRPEPAGEREKIFNKEVHNSVLWNFLAYGIIGGLLLLAGAAGFYRQLELPYRFVVLLPLIIFNMTLYGLRFRFFWITMALLCAASSVYSVSKSWRWEARPGGEAPLPGWPCADHGLFVASGCPGATCGAGRQRENMRNFKAYGFD